MMDVPCFCVLSHLRRIVQSLQIMVTSPLKAAEEPRLRFVNTPYEFWIGLSGSVGSVVGQVTALAADQTEDSAAAIRYTLKHNLRQTGFLSFF